MSKLVSRFVKNESGATAIEYALIAGIMAVALIAAFGILTPLINSSFTTIGNKMQVPG